MRTETGTVTLQGTSFRAAVMPVPLAFPPPYADLSSNPTGFSHWWQLLKLVFDLPDPNRFPPLTGLTEPDSRVLRRFVVACEELAQSTVLAHEGGWEVTLGPDGQADIQTNFPPKEAIRGTTVLFRQLATATEPASYNRVRKILGAAIQRCDDRHREQRRESQLRWNHAHASLQGSLLTAMADRKALQRLGGHPSVPVPGEDVRPQELIAAFQYGDLIHWGSHVEAHEALHHDPNVSAFETLNFLKVVVQLSHFYLGYSLLVRAGMGSRRLPA